MWRRILLWFFGILSTICFLTECYEIAFHIEIYWSDHLHNLIDHIMYIVVNYIGFQFVKVNKPKWYLK
jgi:hypothetical protein